MTDYDKEIDPAKELFWRNIMEAVKHTTKTEILRELAEIKKNTRSLPSLAKVFRDMWRKGAGDIDEHVLK
jgi:hypothetical protein